VGYGTSSNDLHYEFSDTAAQNEWQNRSTIQSRKNGKAPQVVSSIQRDNSREVLTALFSQLSDLIAETQTHEIARMLVERSDILSSLLQLSFLGETMVKLLRNDSINEIEADKDIGLYSALWSLFRRFGEYELFLNFLQNERRDKKSSIGLGKLLSYQGQEDTRESYASRSWTKSKSTLLRKKLNSGTKNIAIQFEYVGGASGISPPIFTYLNNLVKQSTVFLQQTQRVTEEVEDDTMMMFCMDCLGTFHAIENALKQSRRSSFIHALTTTQTNTNNTTTAFIQPPLHQSDRGAGAGLGISDIVVARYQIALKSTDLQFQFVDGLVASTHYDVETSKEILNTGARWLMKELTALSTSLPEGIFVRVEENRLNLIKALIIGPHGTPYQDGLFEYVIWLIVCR